MFKYRLETLLRYRKRLEDEQQRSLAIANRHYLTEVGQIKELESGRKHAMDKMSKAMTGFKSAPMYKLYANYFAGAQEDIKQVSEKAGQLKQLVDMEHETLVEKVKERRILDTHKEREQERFRENESRKERNMFDEISIGRYILRKKENEQN